MLMVFFRWPLAAFTNPLVRLPQEELRLEEERKQKAGYGTCEEVTLKPGSTAESTHL